MSLLGKVGKLVATRVAVSEIGDKAFEKTGELLGKASDKLEQSAKNSWDKLFEKEPGTEILVFNRQSSTASRKLSEALVDRFDIYDENQALRFTVKGKRLSSKRQLEVYDSGGKHLGILKEKLFAFRGLLSLEASPIDFTVELHGKKLGKIKSKGGIVNRKFKIGFNGWQIKGNVFSGKYSIVKGKEEIAKVSRKWEKYVLTFFEKGNELILLMIVLALYSDSVPDKSSIREQNRERKLRKIKFWLGR